MIDAQARQTSFEQPSPALKPFATLMTALAVALFTLTLYNQQVLHNDPAAVAPQFREALPGYEGIATIPPEPESTHAHPTIADDQPWLR